MVSPHYAVSDTSFADDWYARFSKRRDVAIDGADTRCELFSNILGTGYPPSLHVDQDCDESINAVHRSQFYLLFCVFVEGFGVRDRLLSGQSRARHPEFRHAENRKNHRDERCG